MFSVMSVCFKPEVSSELIRTDQCEPDIVVGSPSGRGQVGPSEV